ncbi:MAG TPA: hypothetical protein VIZ20_15385, partial [Streptosporangiaceae bacterium]
MDRRPESGRDEMRSGAPAGAGPRFTPRTYEPGPAGTPRPGRRPGFSPHPGPSRAPGATGPSPATTVRPARRSRSGSAFDSGEHPFVTEYRSAHVPAPAPSGGAGAGTAVRADP